MPFIQNWPDFLHHTARLRSSPSVVDLFHNCIVNYKLVGTQRDPNCREFIREFDGRAPSGHFIHSTVTGNVLISWNSCDTNMASIRYLVKTSATALYHSGVHYIRIQCTTSRLTNGKYGDFPLSTIIFTAAQIADSST